MLAFGAMPLKVMNKPIIIVEKWSMKKGRSGYAGMEKCIGGRR